MIVSVPHTGTRSLKAYLKQNGYWHVGFMDADIKAFNGHIDVPIRDPLAVSLSWHIRYPNEPDKYLRELELWDDLMRYTVGRPNTTFHRVDLLPVHRGRGPKHWTRLKKNRPKVLKMDRIIALKRWVREDNRLKFFDRFFDGFWWL